MVVGIGTGFNVSPVIHRQDSDICLVSEYGHAQLPIDVAAGLTDKLGDAARDFATVEDCFSGSGYQAIHRIFIDQLGADLHHVGQGDDRRDTDFLRFYAELVALMTRNLAMAFVPTSGVYLAGGVARTILASSGRTRFAEVMSRPFAQGPDLSAPVYVIRDDAAALIGCARYSALG